VAYQNGSNRTKSPHLNGEAFWYSVDRIQGGSRHVERLSHTVSAMKDDYERYGDICYLDICEKGQKICSFG
jgi:hypothetical protein